MLECFLVSRKQRSRGVFFLESRKQRWAGVIFPGAENLQQQFFVAAEQPDLYADWVRSSSVCF